MGQFIVYYIKPYSPFPTIYVTCQEPFQFMFYGKTFIWGRSISEDWWLDSTPTRTGACTLQLWRLLIALSALRTGDCTLSSDCALTSSEDWWLHSPALRTDDCTLQVWPLMIALSGSDNWWLHSLALRTGDCSLQLWGLVIALSSSEDWW